MENPTKPRRGAKTVFALVILAAAVAVAATRLDVLQGSAPSQGEADGAEVAPEFTGISTWINSQPLSITSLRGKVTFIDFWTYSCINCLRTLPANRRIYATYHPVGLEMVGVHSPEFSFEKDVGNVRDAVDRLRVTWPVAMDNDMATWRAYRNAYWPRVYLIDTQGRIRFDYAGEGHEAEIEASVRRLLTEAGRKDIPAAIGFGEERFNAHLTPEIYAGYERGSQQGSLANDEGFEPSRDVRYTAPSKQELAAVGTDGAFFVSGTWRAHEEYIEVVEDGATVELPFFAQNVFFVAASAGAPVEVELLLDGKPQGSTVSVSRSDLFTALRLPRADKHVLTLRAGKGFRLFTFTFG
jgi:thiol-disulfide isomerase/thioredoxin